MSPIGTRARRSRDAWAGTRVPNLTATSVYSSATAHHIVVTISTRSRTSCHSSVSTPTLARSGSICNGQLCRFLAYVPQLQQTSYRNESFCCRRTWFTHRTKQRPRHTNYTANERFISSCWFVLRFSLSSLCVCSLTFFQFVLYYSVYARVCHKHRLMWVFTNFALVPEKSEFPSHAE